MTRISGSSFGPAADDFFVIPMAMPFVISLAMSPTGVVAANLADGRVWLSAGGAKLPAGQNKGKRSRKWEGLRDSMSCYKQIATGPVIAR